VLDAPTAVNAAEASTMLKLMMFHTRVSFLKNFALAEHSAFTSMIAASAHVSFVGSVHCDWTKAHPS
jgi:hypothetical protein